MVTVVHVELSWDELVGFDLFYVLDVYICLFPFKFYMNSLFIKSKYVSVRNLGRCLYV